MTDIPPEPASKLKRFVDKMPIDPKRPRHFAVLSFLECTFVPMPIEVLTAPFMAAYPRYAMRIALSMWLACMAGSALFYIFGFLIFEPIIRPALITLGAEATFNEIHDRFTTNGLFWTVFTIGLLPMPLQFASLGAGLMKGNLLVFAAALGVARGMRYFGLALLCRVLGPQVERILVSRAFGLLVAVVLVVAGGVLFWYMWPSITASHFSFKGA